MPTIRLLCVAFLALALTACTQTASRSPASKRSVATQPQVYLLRGGVGGVFSEGMDQIGRQLTARGVANRVVSYTAWNSVLNNLAAGGRRNRKIVLIGHSLGANRAVDIASGLKSRGIRVNALITFAATKVNTIPSNVRRVTNYYFSTGGWGEPVQAGTGFRGRLRNIDVSGANQVNHFNVDETPRYQRQVVSEVRRNVRKRR